MAIDTTPSTVATNALQAIPFSSLIGGPLNACIQAQAQAAKTSWEFIKNVGLTPDGKEAITVTFMYMKGGQMVKLIVPLLAIVPIPYIAIDAVNIDFKANISASSSSVSENTESTNYGGEVFGSMGIGWGPFSLKTDFKANYSSKKDSKATAESKYSVEYTMDVHVGASQAAMPAGLATVLNILQSSITEANPTGDLIASPMALYISKRDDQTVVNIEATAKSSNGLLMSGQEITFTLTPPASSNVTFKTLEVSKGTVKSGTTPSGTTLTGITDDKGILGLRITLDPASTNADKVSVPLAITSTIDKNAKTVNANVFVDPSA